MPLEFAAEVLLRFLFEVVLYSLGYGTGWLLVPALSFGHYTVEPLAPPRRGVRRVRSRGGAHPRRLSAEATALVGLLFWAAAVAIALALWWLAKPG